MSTTGGITLESEYFRVHAGITVGTRNAGEEMRAIEAWTEEHSPLMEKIKALLEKVIPLLKKTLRLRLIPYDPKILKVKTKSFGEIRYIEFQVDDTDPTRAETFKEIEGDVPCRYTMRFKDVGGIDDLYVDVYFLTLPEKDVRVRFKQALSEVLSKL